MLGRIPDRFHGRSGLSVRKIRLPRAWSYEYLVRYSQGKPNVPGFFIIYDSWLFQYAFAVKGTSVLLYRSKQYLHYQYFAQPDWPGGVYASPTLAGEVSFSHAPFGIEHRVPLQVVVLAPISPLAGLRYCITDARDT